MGFTGQGQDAAGHHHHHQLTADAVRDALASLSRSVAAFKMYVSHVQKELRSLRDNATDIKEHLYSKMAEKTTANHSGMRLPRL